MKDINGALSLSEKKSKSTLFDRALLYIPVALTTIVLMGCSSGYRAQPIDPPTQRLIADPKKAENIHFLLRRNISGMVDNF